MLKLRLLLHCQLEYLSKSWVSRSSGPLLKCTKLQRKKEKIVSIMVDLFQLYSKKDTKRKWTLLMKKFFKINRFMEKELINLLLVLELIFASQSHLWL